MTTEIVTYKETDYNTQRITVGSTLIIYLGFSDSVWILATGFWNNDGVWMNDANWQTP